jgi:uncharacterized protein
METIGKIKSLWRYPVKSMRGEALSEMFFGFSGVFGDRIYAFKNTAARQGFPYLNATAHPQMLLYQPQFRHPERALRPPNLFEAMSIKPGVTPANGDSGDLLLDVVAPSGETLAVDDPRLIGMLRSGISEKNELSVIRSDRALTDCRPVSLISLQTIRQIEAETGLQLDQRRFRANVYFELTPANEGFAEDRFVGRRLRLGSQAEIMVLERDPRCKMISLDPETGTHNPDVLRSVAKLHSADAGVYCAVLVEGIVGDGDEITLVD